MAWAWILEIECKVTRQGCAVDLISQQIKILNIVSKNTIEANKFLQKDWARIGINKKKNKYCNTNCHYMSRPKRLTRNRMLIALLGLKKVGVLLIITISPNCIIYWIAKCSSKMLYWPLSLLLLPVVIKK